MLFIIVTCSVGMVFFSINPYFQEVFGLEENFVTLESGIISTENRDFAVSNDFQTKIYQNGKIMRLSGVTTTGEPYYIYQKNMEDEVILRGKILVSGSFVSIIHREIVPEVQVPLEASTPMIVSTKIPHHTYAGYPMIISVKVFDAEQNPQANHDQRFGGLEDVFVNITITNEFDQVITSLNGTTDSDGLFRTNYYIREGIDKPGEYTVDVQVVDKTTSIDESYTTFFRGDIRDYWENR